MKIDRTNWWQRLCVFGAAMVTLGAGVWAAVSASDLVEPTWASIIVLWVVWLPFGVCWSITMRFVFAAVVEWRTE